MRLFFSLLFSIFFAYPCFSGVVELEPITISKFTLGRYPLDADILLAEDIKKLPLFSLEKIADYSSGVDIRQRAPGGVQQDVFLRGANFEDTRLAIEGISISDPQTGHFTMEVPLTRADLKEVEVYKNSRLINIKLAAPKTKGAVFASSFGEHALFEQLLSVNFSLKSIKNRLSFEHKSSKGDRQDTDFEIYNFSFHSLWENQAGEIQFLLGSTKRDFGANSFYSSHFSQEEEHISQRFFSGRFSFRGEGFELDNAIFFRRHWDKFILDRHNPEFYTNYHTTYLYGFETGIEFDNKAFVDIKTRKEKITSTNLGNHSRTGAGLYLGLKDKRAGGFIFDLEAGFDYYREWGCLESLHLGLGYSLSDNLKFQFIFDRLCRKPSFTELYYISPANKGDASLKSQKTNNFEAGFDYYGENVKLAFGVFLNKQAETIDWVKDGPTDPWQAKNIEDLKILGFD
ncbi:MAG: TonB-dependent receptor, partial [Candidatus Omnitrophica bacterium]|nr:TonB-dependent receptor [Candidatus Omnitrophota bacterium]MBD3269586.1 TonB-dependent receptor [Candidatus Omnitrophota bacterium]